MFRKLIFSSPNPLRVFSRQSYFFATGNESGKSNPQGPNPYYNPSAAQLKKGLDESEEIIKEWQAGFKHKHGRKPTFEEMKRDPTIGHLIKGGLNEQKKAIVGELNKMR